MKTLSEADIAKLARRRRRLMTDYEDWARTSLAIHSGHARTTETLASRCFTTVRRQFLPHYFGVPPGWRVWIRQFLKERALPDFCVVGPGKSGSSDLAITIMSHPNVLYPLIKELSATDALAWRPFYPTVKAVQRHAERHGLALCAFVAPYLHCAEIPVTMSALRPDEKIVITLRNPVDLMFSTWKWIVLRSEKQLVDRVPYLATFSAYVDQAMELFHEAPGPLAAMLHPGIYATSVTHWLRAFGEKNVRIFDIAEYFRDRSVFLARFEEFVGLPHVPLPPRLPVANRNPLDALTPDAITTAKLRTFYEPYNRRLWKVIGTEYAW